mgnify:FL=1
MAIGRPVSLTSNVASKSISVTATASQTLFTVTGGYRINQLTVFRNGLRLVDGTEYTARDGSTVTLVSAASAGDVLQFQIFDDFRVANAIQADAGDQSINGSLSATGGFNVGIQSGGTDIATGVITAINFLGVGNTFVYDSSTKIVDISLAGAGAGGTWATYDSETGITTTKKVRVANDFSVTGVSTFTGAIDANGNLDVAGFSTFNSAIRVGTAITIDPTSGIITATQFKGNLDGNITGSVTGVATGADNLVGSPDITINNLTGVAATFSGAVTVGGVLTYDDVTNVDSIGLVTARSGIKIGPTAGVGGTFTSDGSYITAGIITASNVSASSSVTATTFYGSGANLTGIEAASFLFNTGVSSSVTLAATGIGTTALTLPSTSGKQYIVHSILASNVSTGNTEVNFVGAFDFNGGHRSYFAKQIPIPTGMSVEMLKQPQVLNPSDVIMVRSTDFNRNGTDDIIDVFISYEEKTSTDLVGVGLGTVGIADTSAIGIFTSTSNPSVIQSIRLANVTDAGGKIANVIVSGGSTDRFLVENLVVPKYASIEVLDNLKRIETNQIIKIQIDEASTIDVQLSAKKITS